MVGVVILILLLAAFAFALLALFGEYRPWKF